MKSIEQRLSLLEKRVGIVENKEIYKIGDLVQLSNGDIWKVVRYGMNRPEDNLKPNEIVMKPVKSPGSISLPIPWTYEYLEKMGAKVIKESRNYKLSQKESIQRINGQRIKIYDNGGETLDRYTIVFLDLEKYNGYYQGVGTSETGSGFYQHIEVKLGRHLGREVSFSSLNPRLQSLIKQEFEEVNESKKRPRKKIIESELNDSEKLEIEHFQNLTKRKQIDYFQDWVSGNYGLVSKIGSYMNIIFPFKLNPKIKSTELQELVWEFNEKFSSDFSLRRLPEDTSLWGRSYVIAY